MALLAPLELEPSFDPRIWGRRDLSPLFPDRSKLPEPIGEAWLTGPEARFVSGPFASATLAESWTRLGSDVLGTRVRPEGEFPLLAKFLFPEEKLSIQVHPGDAYARTHGGRGKTEMWHVVEAHPGAWIRLGLKPGIRRDGLLRALRKGTIEECLNKIPVAAGDVLFCPAGTVHTIGPGATLCEIQEPSDTTYRLFDYNRLTAAGTPRPLHVEQALDVIRFGSKVPRKIAPWPFPHAGSGAWLLLACPYFATEKYAGDATMEFSTDAARFELLIVVGGSGKLAWNGGERAYRSAEVFLMPARLGSYRLEPEQSTSALLTYVPDLEKDFSIRPGEPVPRHWAGVVFPQAP